MDVRRWKFDIVTFWQIWCEIIDLAKIYDVFQSSQYCGVTFDLPDKEDCVTNLRGSSLFFQISFIWTKQFPSEPPLPISNWALSYSTFNDENILGVEPNYERMYL